MEPTSVPPASVTPSWDVFPQQTLEPLDIAVLVLYFLFVLAVGLWVSTHSLQTSPGPWYAGKWGCFGLRLFFFGWNRAAFHSSEQVEGGVLQVLVLSSAWAVPSVSLGRAVQAGVSQGFESPCEEEAV